MSESRLTKRASVLSSRPLRALFAGLLAASGLVALGALSAGPAGAVSCATGFTQSWHHLHGQLPLRRPDDLRSQPGRDHLGPLGRERPHHGGGRGPGGRQQRRQPARGRGHRDGHRPGQRRGHLERRGGRGRGLKRGGYGRLRREPELPTRGSRRWAEAVGAARSSSTPRRRPRPCWRRPAGAGGPGTCGGHVTGGNGGGATGGTGDGDLLGDNGGGGGTQSGGGTGGFGNGDIGRRRRRAGHHPDRPGHRRQWQATSGGGGGGGGYYGGGGGGGSSYRLRRRRRRRLGLHGPGGHRHLLGNIERRQRLGHLELHARRRPSRSFATVSFRLGVSGTYTITTSGFDLHPHPQQGRVLAHRA